MFSHRFTSTSNAMQMYYKARHDMKHKKDFKKLQTILDTRNNANKAKNFVQSFKAKHGKSTIEKFLEWLNK